VYKGHCPFFLNVVVDHFVFLFQGNPAFCSFGVLRLRDGDELKGTLLRFALVEVVHQSVGD